MCCIACSGRGGGGGETTQGSGGERVRRGGYYGHAGVHSSPHFTPSPGASPGTAARPCEDRRERRKVFPIRSFIGNFPRGNSPDEADVQ